MTSNSLEDVAKTCNYLLENFSPARPYLDYLDERIERSSQKKFMLGYFPESNHINILTREVGEEFMLENSLLHKYALTDSLAPRIVSKSYFEDHPIIIPYRDVYGNVIGLIGRTLLNDSIRKDKKIDKYKNTKFRKGNCLYGLYEAKKSILEQDSVYIVEGQFDVMKAHEHGLTNIVALGNSSMTLYQFSLICRYTKNIKLLLDNDNAGDAGRKLVRDKFGKFANVHDFYIPLPYKDLDEYLKENKGYPSFYIKT